MKNIRIFIFIIVATLIGLMPIPVNAKEVNDTVKFSKCVDGDTAKFLLNGEEITVRFLAIDTPETKHPKKGVEPYGKEASDYTCNTLKNANKIVLEYDEKSSKTDKYNRYLAWVWADDILLQKDLVEKGLAKVAYLYGDYKYVDELKKTESLAQENGLNIWSDNNIDSKNIKIDDEEYSKWEFISFIITISIAVLILIKIEKDNLSKYKKIKK